MRILAFSDWRVQDIDSILEIADDLEPKPDLVLYGGDDVERFWEDGRNFFSELAEKTKKNEILFVFGNDDIPSRLPEEFLDSDKITNLYEKPTEFGDYAFLGIEGSLGGILSNIIHTEEEIEKKLDEQMSQVNAENIVLLSHMPPKGILDISQRYGEDHIGSLSIRRFIDRDDVNLNICGHCHQFGGKSEEISGATVLNVSSHDTKGAKGNYAIIELNKGDLSYELKTTEEGIDYEITQLTYVGEKRLESLRDNGFTELGDFKEERKKELCSLPQVGNKYADLWIKEAKAIRNEDILVDGEERFDFLKEDPLILFDIETNLAQDHLWLLGAYSPDRGFKNFFEPDNEKKLLENFVKYLSSFESPKLVSYSGTKFDERILKNRLEEYSMLDQLPYDVEFHDLGAKVQFGLIGDFRFYKLSKLASRLADYEFEHDDLTGFEVGGKFTKYKLDDESPNWEKLKKYNKDDVMAIESIMEEIRSRTE
ncbi:MAG: ribonuclease H-like domain-containing protein [Candidatus Nanohaloarchaea archaeon]